MKKLLAIVLSFSFFALNASAQTARKVNSSQKVQQDSTHRRKGTMMKDLKLTKEQQAQMKEFHQSTKQQMDAIKNDATLTPEQKKAKMKELRQSQHQKMNSILTPEQQEKIKADKDEWKEKNKGKKLNNRKHHNAAFTPNGKDDK